VKIGVFLFLGPAADIVFFEDPRLDKLEDGGIGSDIYKEQCASK
jgi:hypothetical protein